MSISDVSPSARLNDARPSEWDGIKRDRFYDNRDPKDVISPPENDPVNKPAHYKHSGDIECIDAIKAMLGREGFIYYCEGNAMKYMWRWRYKGGVESLRKCRWYIDRLIKTEVGE
jgi:hypothetical protein